jgi:putative redox protein
VTVAESGRGRYQNDVTIGTMRFIADEPPSVGGDGAGPNPYDYLCAALGACTSITLRMYADRKKWPLERVEVDVDHRRVDGQDHFDRSLVLRGALDASQRKRLLEIADRCPVHRSLEGTAVITTEMVGVGS